MDNEFGISLATEIMHELKSSAKRWFIAFIIMCIIEVCTIAGFLWYISLPAEEDTTEISQSADDIDDSDIEQVIGDDE